MTFSGWPASAVAFLAGLETDNTKAYWQANKRVYDEEVRPPMEALLTELAPEFGEGRIFRPYRDVRFSADKTPYKTTISAMLGRGGYVQLSADALGAGCGDFHMPPERLERFRRAVADDRSGEDLARRVAAVRGSGATVAAHGELKTAPRGYPRDHPRVDLLRLKGLVAWQEWPAEAALDAGAADLVRGLLRRSAPVQEWLAEHVAG